MSIGPDGSQEAGMRERRGFTLVELMIVIAIIAVLAAIAIPGIVAATRAANERNASSSLKTIAAAEVSVKTGDLDQDGRNNYWTADVAGLYYLSPRGAFYSAVVKTPAGGFWWTVSVPRKGAQGIQLIEYSLALADSDTVNAYNGTGLPVISHAASPKAGYWYQNLYSFQPSSPFTYTPFNTRHDDRFGFIAWPDNYGVSGRLIFNISEGMAVFKIDPGRENLFLSSGHPTAGQTTDTNADLTFLYDTYAYDIFGPDAGSAKGGWSKLD
jgi:prepilin-type N-terminal cleavage/methylation domain-containing protein